MPSTAPIIDSVDLPPENPFNQFVGQKIASSVARRITIQSTAASYPMDYFGNLGSIDYLPTSSPTEVTIDATVPAAVHQRIISSGALANSPDLNWLVNHERTSAAYRINHLLNDSTGTTSVLGSPIQIYQSDGIANIVVNSNQITVNGVNFSDPTLIYERQEIDATGNLRLIYSVKDFNHESYASQVRQQSIKNFIKSNLLIKIAARSKPLNPADQINEQKARQTLRDMITESEWRRYLTNGFIMVKGQSGHWYQIFERDRVRVYFQNKLIESICIHTDSSCPPTDHVINCKIMVELDEENFRKGGNIRQLSSFSETQKPQPKKNLVEAFAKRIA